MEQLIKKISIIIPLYNEAESLQELCSEIIKIILVLPYDYEIIFIDDGSTDNSLKKLKELREKNNKITIIELRKNFGKSEALFTGFSEASGDLIITMDADLQDEPSEIPNFVNEINKGYDLVSGWKKYRKDPLIKIISSKIFNFTVAMLTGVKLHDFNCGFKAYRKEVAKNIDIYGDLHRLIPVLAHQKGFKIGEMIISHKKRKFGSSKYGKWGLRRLKNYLLDPVNILLLTKYSEKPAHFFGSLGVISFLTGFLLSLYLSILWLLNKGPIGNRPLLFLGVLLMVIGIQLISMGFLGEIIIKSSREKQNKFYVKKITK